MALIPKDQIMEMLTARGEEEQIPAAANELPDPVDTNEHGEVLAELGVKAEDLEDSGGGGLKFGV